jgi:DNA-directed RNA polymerase III subunit RPC11
MFSFCPTCANLLQRERPRRRRRRRWRSRSRAARASNSRAAAPPPRPPAAHPPRSRPPAAVEASGGAHVLRCKTCAYIYHIRGCLVREAPLAPKRADDVLGGEGASAGGARTEATCPACGPVQAYFHEVQTRSADEPATVFYRCTLCDKRWKE